MSVSEEVWQGYDLQGEPTDTPVTLPAAAQGELHGASHVWIWRHGASGVELLLQVRAKDKRTWPDCYDISAAGHIVFGDTPLSTALRETREEIGLELTAADLRLLFVQRQHFVALGKQPTVEHEFRWVYCYELKHDTEFRYLDEEVDDTHWASLAEFDRLVHNKTRGRQLVPQGDSYFAALLDGLERFGAA